MVWSGFEIGIALAYPHESIERDYRYVEHHPLAEAYYAYEPPPHDRPTWDLTACCMRFDLIMAILDFRTLAQYTLRMIL